MSIYLHPATAALFAAEPTPTPAPAPAPLDPAAAWLEALNTRLVSGRVAAVEQLLEHWPCQVVQAWPGCPNLNHSWRLHSCLWFDIHETRFGLWWVHVVALGWFQAVPAAEQHLPTAC